MRSTRRLTVEQMAMLRAVHRGHLSAEMHGWMNALYRGDYSSGQRRTLRTLCERGLVKAVGDCEHFMLTDEGKAAL
jgi:hypothetical protein